ncbi:hypothetical protein HY496_03175 [Candidatus Woesearchaeota archaeon]|nr:hypothetical protein [Candidatus Woesearchaeota archaeon]
MLHRLRAIGLALAFGASTIACGPDTINQHYYGREDDNPSSDNNFNSKNQVNFNTCTDAAEAQDSCYSQNGWKTSGKVISSSTYFDCIEGNFCATMDSDCIDCIVESPCEDLSIGKYSDGHRYLLGTPWQKCMESGLCPPSYSDGKFHDYCNGFLQ